MKFSMKMNEIISEGDFPQLFYFFSLFPYAFFVIFTYADRARSMFDERLLIIAIYLTRTSIITSLYHLKIWYSLRLSLIDPVHPNKV